MTNKPLAKAPAINAVAVHYKKHTTALPDGGSYTGVCVFLRLTWAEGRGEDRVSIDHFMARSAALAPLLDDGVACRKVSVAPGGMGIMWGAGQGIPAELLWNAARAQDQPEGAPWCAEVLAEPPVVVRDDTKVSDIVGPLQEKLEAVMEFYDCDPTPEGWRKLALSLVLDMQEGRRVVVKTPYSRHGAGKPGRPPFDPYWVWLMAQEIRESDNRSEPITAKQAADRMKKTHKCSLSVRRLENLYSEFKNLSTECDDIRYSFQRPDFLLMLLAGEAMDDAASRLEEQSRECRRY